MSGAGRDVKMTGGSSIEFMEYWIPQHNQNGCTISLNKSVSYVRHVAQMDATGKTFQMTKFPNTLSFVIILGMFGGNFTKIGQI